MQQSYWDVELDRRPWAEVEAWQAQQIAGFVPQLALRSEFYKEHLRVSAGAIAHRRALDALDAIPFTTTDELRRAQLTAVVGSPFGANQAAVLDDIVQAVAHPARSRRLDGRHCQRVLYLRHPPARRGGAYGGVADGGRRPVLRRRLQTDR